MPTPLKTGEVLRSRYKIRRIIGHGGMGSIYLADDLRLEGRQCALKEVEHDRTLPQEVVQQAREQFLREATVFSAPGSPKSTKSIRLLFHRTARLPGDGLRARERFTHIDDGSTSKGCFSS